jgi:hypothetical protein
VEEGNVFIAFVDIMAMVNVIEQGEESDEFLMQSHLDGVVEIFDFMTCFLRERKLT